MTNDECLRKITGRLADIQTLMNAGLEKESMLPGTGDAKAIHHFKIMLAFNSIARIVKRHVVTMSDDATEGGS